jgi:hypothetical protein
VDFFIRRHNSCFYLPLRGSNDRPVKSAKPSITVLVQSSEASMGTLIADQKVREYNRGQKAAREGRSRYWSEPVGPLFCDPFNRASERPSAPAEADDHRHDSAGGCALQETFERVSVQD